MARQHPYIPAAAGKRLLIQAEDIPDPVKRREIMVESERILQEGGPLVQPAWYKSFTFYDKRVQGFALHPTNSIFGEALAISA